MNGRDTQIQWELQLRRNNFKILVFKIQKFTYKEKGDVILVSQEIVFFVNCGVDNETILFEATLLRQAVLARNNEN